VKSRREGVLVVLRRITVVVRQVRIAFTFTASAFTLKTDRLCLVALDSSDPAKGYEAFKEQKILETHLLNSTAGICQWVLLMTADLGMGNSPCATSRFHSGMVASLQLLL
jgi:hypothetical protein